MILDITARKEAESKAAAAETRFRTFTERGPAVIYSFELSYHGDNSAPSVGVTYVSPQAADLVGTPIDRWLGSPEVWFEMIHPDDRAQVARTTEHNFRSGVPWASRYRLIRSDGSVIWLLDAGRMLERDGLGRPSTFQGILLDVTEDEEARSQLETNELLQRQTLEGALAVPWSQTIDPGTGSERYSYIGPQVLDILGYTPEELMIERKHFPRMVHPDDRARMRESTLRAAQTGIWEETYRVLRRDGGIRWLHSFGRRSSPAGVAPEEWHGVTIDVTASRARETAPSEDPVGTAAERTSPAPDTTVAEGR